MRLFSCFLILVLLLPFAANAAPVIKDVIVKGNAKVQSEAIQTILSSKKGQELSADAVRDDILTLYELGFFFRYSHSERDSCLVDKPGGLG